MKKVLTIILSIVLLCICIAPITAISAEKIETPILESVSFNNAKINETYSPTEYDYTLTLDNPEVNPTLKDYSIKGSANIFVNYSVDEAKRQDGITVTIEYSAESTTIQTVYEFKYSNVDYSNTSDNSLQEVSANLCEVYPQINDKDTDYDLFVPSDMTELTLFAATKDVSSTVQIPGTIILTKNQEPSIPVTVTAGNGATRTYTFEIKRLDKTCEQVKAEMADPNFVSIIKGELFYQKPEFLVITCGVISGALLLAIFVFIAKRATIKVGDDSEVEFFDYE